MQRAEAQLANLEEGQRPSEIAVIEAQIAEAQASLDAERRDFERQLQLFERGVIREARLDQAREEVRVAEARVAAAERERDVAEMPARTPEIEAAERAVEGGASRARPGEDAACAPHRRCAARPARIEDVHYELGEVASAGAPVLSLLPPDRRKVIFFVPEPARPVVQVGATVSIGCDGCPDGLSARGELSRERGGIHPAGDLQPRHAREAGVSRRGVARRRSGEPAARPAGRRGASPGAAR